MKRIAIASGAASALAVLAMGLSAQASADTAEPTNSVVLHGVVVAQGPYDGDGWGNLGNVDQGDGGFVKPRPTGPERPGYGPSAHGR